MLSGPMQTAVFLPLAKSFTKRSSSPDCMSKCYENPLEDSKKLFLYAIFLPTPIYG